jgi:hypothetical protein
MIVNKENSLFLACQKASVCIIIIIIVIIFYNNEINRSEQNTEPKALINIKNLSNSKATNKSSILLMTVLIGDFWYKPLAKANRKNYCNKHGYHLSFVENSTEPVEQRLGKAWLKVKELLRVMKETTHEWIFMLDGDLFIMNTTIAVEYIIQLAVAKKYVDKLEEIKIANNVTLDVAEQLTYIVLAKDLSGFNTGSLLIRNNNFTRKFFEEIWSKRFDQSIPDINNWWEQAVFILLVKNNPSINNHISLLTQKDMNAYSHGAKRLGDYYIYKRGDYILHFASSPLKNDIKDYVDLLIEIQPEMKVVNDARLEECAKFKQNCAN